MTGQRTDRADPPVAPEAEPAHGRGLAARVHRVRSRIRDRPKLNTAWRIGVGIVGTLVLVLGVIAIPYPGPGWLIVFAGLGLLASEFSWAARVLGVVSRRYDAWMVWFRRQHVVVQLLFGLVTVIVVVATLWLLNAFGLVGGWFGLERWTWLRSPLLG